MRPRKASSPVFSASLQGFVTIVLIVTALVALCIVFIAANTASMAVRERAGELAVLKAIGFTRRVIFGTLFAEAVVLVHRCGPARRRAHPQPDWRVAYRRGRQRGAGTARYFMVTAPVIVQGVFLSLFVGMLAGVVPSWGAARKSVVQTLHEVF